jgi:hypothetical protein
MNKGTSLNLEQIEELLPLPKAIQQTSTIRR